MRPITHVLLAYDFAFVNGGQAKVAIDTATLLANSGIGVTFFAACGPVDESLRRPGVEVICLGQKDILADDNRLRAIRQGVWNAHAARSLAEAAARFDPETTVLHCHGYAKALSPAIGPVLADGPLPSVYTMHEYFLACPNGGFYDFQKGEICRRRPLGVSCLSTNCDVRSVAQKVWRVARQAATWGPGRMPRGLRDVIYISELQREVMAPNLPDSVRLHYLPNPLPSSDRPRVDAAMNDVYLFVGRLTPEKGGRMFAEAARRLGVRAVFVGDGPERDAIAQANPDAEMVGWRSPDEVQDWLGRARALVFPSVWYETAGLAPLEALARGVPVVCGDWCAASERVIDGVNGAIYRAPTVEALCAALTRVAGVAGEGVRLGADLSPEAHLVALREIYERLPDGRG